MDRFEGTCHLDWWANSSLNLAGDAVSVVITTDGPAWSARGHLLDTGDQALEGFAFLCGLDPVFTLRFPDEAAIHVTVHPATRPGHFTLTGYTGPAEHRVELTIDH